MKLTPFKKKKSIISTVIKKKKAKYIEIFTQNKSTRSTMFCTHKLANLNSEVIWISSSSSSRSNFFLLFTYNEPSHFPLSSFRTLSSSIHITHTTLFCPSITYSVPSTLHLHATLCSHWFALTVRYIKLG